MITEWNVSSQPKNAEKIFKTPGAWGEKFIQLLVSCYSNKIDRLYLFKLMDSHLFDTVQLGAFDSSGKSKKWFREFVAIWRVIWDGYLVQALSQDGFSIQGRNGTRIILAGRKTIEIDGDHYYFSYLSNGNHIDQSSNVSAGEWAVLGLNKTR